MENKLKLQNVNPYGWGWVSRRKQLNALRNVSTETKKQYSSLLDDGNKLKNWLINECKALKNENELLKE